jgi:hypothetical protein
MGRAVHSGDKISATIVDLSTHLVLTLLLAWYFKVSTGGWSWPLLCIAGGILIDLDHFIDYFLYYGATFNVGDFFSHGYLDSGKCYVFFHSIELMLALWGLAFFVSWAIPLVTGMTLHMAVDLVTAGHRGPMFFSLYYRWKKGFDREKILPKRWSARTRKMG